MTGDEWRKRLNSRAKRKNYYDSTMKSHISLEWDGNHKKVVARREQIGITWKDMSLFAAAPSLNKNKNNFVADVLPLPQDIYALQNLKQVLSYEVWQAYLSESERNHLMQFLPPGIEPDQLLQALFAGDNFHFGSPFLNWSSSLRLGELHPDAICKRHQSLMNEKKAYYAQLHKYHNNMIGNLLKLKERFERCKDPEKEIVLKKWRYNVLEDNVVASSESCSWDADEKACSSDNQNQTVSKDGELHNRLYKKDALKDKGGNPSVVSGDVLNIGAKPRKGDNKQQQNDNCNDGAKYMSYFKISKKQHEIVKNMKQSGKSIQSKSLNRVLGNIDSFDVQPYQVFIEEEQKKLHEYWIQMANKALPAAWANWRDLSSQKQQLRKSLEQEIKERSKMLIENEEDSGSHKTVLEDQIENGVENHIRILEDDEKSVSGSVLEESQQEYSSGKEYESMEIDSEKDTVTKSDHATPNASDNANSGDVELSQGIQLSCGGDVWPAANISHSYYDSTASHEYTSDDGLTIAPPKGNEEQQTDLIELESSLQVEETGKDVVHRQPEDTTSFRQSEEAAFDSYSNQDRNDLFQSFFKGDEMLIYHHEQKQNGLDFQSTNNMLMEDGQFPGDFQEQQHPSLPIERMHKRENEGYVQNISEQVYSDSGRFLIPRQESLVVGVDVNDWSVRVAQPMQSHLNLNGGELPNWFSSEHQVRGGWTGASVPSQSQNMGSRNGNGGGGGGDQSLYSVLSQCNQLRSSSPYESVRSSAEQFIPGRNYGVMSGSTNHPGMSNNIPLQQSSLEYMSGREAAASSSSSLMGDEMGWMGLPHHDPMGKPYLRSWNQ